MPGSPVVRERRGAVLALALFVSVFLCFGAQLSGKESLPQEPIPITVEAITERVVNFRIADPPRFGSVISNNVVVVATEKGLVVIDTGYYPRSAVQLRETIEAYFGRNDFAYVIITHHDWDHIAGTEAFEDVPIIGHANLRPAMEEAITGFEGFLQNRRERRAHWRSALEELDPGTPEALEAEGWAWAHHRFLGEVEFGLSPIFPTIIVQGSLTLHLGDLHLRILHVPGIHTDNDLVIHVPEEGVLITGDILFPGSSPVPEEINPQLLGEGVAVLSSIESEYDPVEWVVPGHSEIQQGRWFRENLAILKSALDSIGESGQAHWPAESPIVVKPHHCAPPFK